MPRRVRSPRCPITTTRRFVALPFRAREATGGGALDRDSARAGAQTRALSLRRELPRSAGASAERTGARVTPRPPEGLPSTGTPPSRRAFLDPEPGGMSALKEAATRTTRSARVRKQAMELTEAAAARIKDLLTSKQKPYLKIGVRTRG